MSSSNSMTPKWASTRRGLVPLVGAGLLTLAACSSGYGSSGGQAAGAAPKAGSVKTTVAVATVSGHKALETAAGRVLYVNDQEHGTVTCKSSACTAIWIPLTVAPGQKPTAPSSVTGTLGTAARPGAKPQVTLDGMPLYTFSFDHSAGQAGGDGQHDSFDGTNFSWHLALAGGKAAAPAPAANTSPVNRYGY